MKDVESIQKFERFGSVLGLERISLLMERFGNPQDQMNIVHVAGTNGKGSVSRYIYETMRESGRKPGIFISPFLEKFNERIEYAGQLITDGEIQKYSDMVVAEADRMVEEGMDSPTEFEIITAMAFLYFRDKKADPVILEVGLGGRGDSTNIVKHPLATVFTSISFDHMDRLGNSIEQIAAEKAGILKEDCPAISGVRDKKAEQVIRDRAKNIKAPFYSATNGSYTIERENLEGTAFRYKGKTWNLSMRGRHQVENAITAIETIEVLNMGITDEQLANGLKRAVQPGRFETLQRNNPLIILDGAHNQAGAEALKNTVKTLLKDKRILVVTGMLKDKDVDAITENLTEITGDFIVTEPDNPRRLSGESLAKIITAAGGSVHHIMTPQQAADFALKEAAEKYEAVLFAGSLYLIGTIRRLLKNG